MRASATTRALGIVLTGALLAVPAFAAEAGEHGGHAAADDTFLGLPRWVFLLFNLAVFIGILAKYAGPALIRFLEDKQRELAHQLAEAQRQREEAESMEARLAAQIAELRHEIDEVLARAEREGAREREEILAEAEREGARIEAAVHAEMAQGLQQAKQQLTAHAARLAAELAEQRLTTGLTREDKKQLFRDNLARLERKAGG